MDPFTSQHITVLSWVVNASCPCHVCRCLPRLMYLRGEISCQAVSSQLSGNGFINHAWLHMGEQPPFGWGLKHLWQRASSLLWAGITSENALCQKHIWWKRITEDWCLPSLKFDAMKLRQERWKGFYLFGAKLYCWADNCRKGYWGHLNKVTQKNCLISSPGFINNSHDDDKLLQYQ